MPTGRVSAGRELAAKRCRESPKGNSTDCIFIGRQVVTDVLTTEARAAGRSRKRLVLLPPAPAPELVRVEVTDRLRNVCDLREDCIFQLRSVRDERVERTDTSHRSVEILKQLISDAGSQLCAVTK